MTDQGRGWVRSPKRQRPETERHCRDCIHRDMVGRCWGHRRTQWTDQWTPVCEFFEDHDEEAEYWLNNWNN